MTFWNQTATRVIRNSMENFEKQLKNIKANKKITEDKRFEQIKDFNIEKIKLILKNIEDAKKEISEKAEEEKSRSWIDEKYDPEIDNLAKKELNEIDELKKELNTNLGLIEDKDFSNEDKFTIFEEIQKRFEKEEKEISARESDSDKKIRELTEQTLQVRLKRTSADITPNSTKDGVRWSNIAQVARELGGWIEVASTHQLTIRFPNATRPIPLSRDVGSRLLAEEIKEQLQNFLPAHKAGSLNVSNIRKALNAGRLLAAA